MKTSRSDPSLVEIDLHVDESEEEAQSRQPSSFAVFANALKLSCYPLTSGEMFTKRWMSGFYGKIKSNMRSGVTVSLVNVCLSLSLAISSNSTPSAGAITAIFAGLLHSLFAGSGPTGALSGILAIYALKYGLAALSYLAIFTGIICFCFFAFRLERYVLLVPSSVTEGFTLGVAVILALGQLNFLLGLPKLPKHPVFVENVMEQLKNISQADWHIAVMFAVTITSMLILNKKVPKIPWVIPVNIIGIILGYYVNKYEWFNLPTLESRYGHVEMDIQYAKWDSSMFNVDMVTAAVSVSFVAVLETLISAKIADGMTKTTFAQSKEVLALSLGNIASGFFGGFPATAALARTALNLKSGCNSSISETINAIFLFGICYYLISLFNHLPLFIVAASIWFAAIRMVDFHRFKRFWSQDKRVFFMAIGVAVLCAVFDPTTGLAVGMIVSLLVFADAMSGGHSEIVLSQGGQTRMVSQREVVYSVDMAKLRKKFPYVDPNSGEFQRLAEMYSKQPMPMSRQSSSANLAGMGSTNYGSTKTTDVESGVKSPSPTLEQRQPSSPRPLSPRDVPMVEQHGHVVVYRIAGQLTFINSFSHLERIKHFAEDDSINTVVLALRFLFFVDLDGTEMIDECIEMLTAKGKKVMISGVSSSVSNMIASTHWFKELRKEGRVFKTYADALVNEEGVPGEISHHGSYVQFPSINESHPMATSSINSKDSDNARQPLIRH